MTIKIVTATDSSPILTMGFPRDREEKEKRGITFIFTLYRPRDGETVMVDQISENIDIFSEYLAASFHIFSKFNIHQKEWLDHSNKTYKEAR